MKHGYRAVWHTARNQVTLYDSEGPVLVLRLPQDERRAFWEALFLATKHLPVAIASVRLLAQPDPQGGYWVRLTDPPRAVRVAPGEVIATSARLTGAQGR